MPDLTYCPSGDRCPHQEQAHTLATEPVIVVMHHDGRTTITTGAGVDADLVADHLDQLAGVVRRREHLQDVPSDGDHHP